MHLDRILDNLTVELAPVAYHTVRPGETISLGSLEHASMLYALAGHGLGRKPSGEPVELDAHTVVVSPPGASIGISGLAGQHGAKDAASLRRRPTADLPATSADSGDGCIRLASIGFAARYLQTTELFDYLHEPLALDFSGEPSFRTALQALLREMDEPRPGSGMLAKLLMQQCLIFILRRFCARDGEFSGVWTAAITNPGLGRAIAAILDRPDKRHTLQGLADTAGMGRTAFAKQFKALTGRTPIVFLREIRLRLAVRLLRSTELPIKVIAARVGFESRSYFSKAFKVFTGDDPATFRSNQAGPLRLRP